MRPYFHQSADELEKLAHSQWSEPEVLLNLVVELFHRRTEKARALRSELVQRFAELVEDGFPWPTTDAPLGSGVLDAGWPQMGLLSFLGYHVGGKGLPNAERREILDGVYQNQLPPVNSPEYMAEWGEPQTATRLRKLAESIAAYTRNGKRRNTDMSDAVDDWEEDLELLWTEYYVGRYDFAWPQSDVG